MVPGKPRLTTSCRNQSHFFPIVTHNYCLSSTLQQRDYSHFREERRETAAAYRGSLTGTKRARLFDPSKHCLRGVENHCMPRTNQARRERRFAVIEAVLKEQDQQRLQGVFDPVSIRMCAVVISTPATILATERGELDAQYVTKEEQHPTTPTWRSFMTHFRAAGPPSKIMSIPKPWNE